MQTSRHFTLFVADADGVYRQATDQEILNSAHSCLDARMERQGEIASVDDAKSMAALRLGSLGHEVFAVMFLDSVHRVIEFEELFRGTINATTVYPREVAKEALLRNARAIICVHNHPSGNPEPSDADVSLTRQLKSALEQVDVHLIDHLVVGGGRVTAFTERGLI